MFDQGAFDNSQAPVLLWFQPLNKGAIDCSEQLENSVFKGKSLYFRWLFAYFRLKISFYREK
jgi:hypothetical protein